MSQNSELVPKRRFKEFENAGDWEQRKLKEVSTIYDGTHQTPKYTVSGVMFLSVENIKTLKSNKYISQEAFDENFKIKPEKGDILMTRIGDIGTPNVVESDEEMAYYVSLALIKSKMHPYFMKANILATSFQNELWKRTLHIAFPKKINKNEIGETILNFPNYVEQKKIGSFFKHLDDTITLHQHKLDKLNNLKQSYLYQMFPQNGQKVPTLRFAGFSGDWKRHKFFDTINTTIDFRGRTPKKLGMDWSDSGYLALSALNVKNGYIDESVDAHYGNEELYRKWMSGKELKKGQVIFTTEAPMGNVAQVPDNKGYILSQRTIAFDVNDAKITNDFLAVLLRSPNVFNNLTSLSSGGTAKGVSQKSLANLNINIPTNLNEQSKIGNFFKILDDTIKLHQQELEKLKNLKEAYLNEMFV
uniref:restriction endonuclease subunit S n=1 Tax=Aerococcus urinaeequi TaxID=51665 RepID=UPI00352A9D54